MTNSLGDMDTLYRRHAPLAFRRARRLLGSEVEAHEVVHDVFVSLIERPEQFGGRSSVTTFLYGAITHACLNRIRNRKNQLRLLREHGPNMAKSSNTWDAELGLQLRAALAEMPESLARVAVYYYVDELTREQIADLMQCSLRQVGYLLQRLAACQVDRKEPA